MAREQLQTLTEPMYYILLALTTECCGVDIMEKVKMISHGRVKVGPGTLYAMLARFEGDFILQTMFLHSDDFDSHTEEALEGWRNIVRKLRPREVMVYTIDRETPDKMLSKCTVEEMENFVRPLTDEGFTIQIRG